MIYKLKTISLYTLGFLAFNLPSAYSQIQSPKVIQPEDVSRGISLLDSMAAAEFSTDSLGCINLGIVYNGKLFWMKSYGFSDTARKISATSDLIFPIGSITKQFTGLMLLQLVEQGKVHLSDPVEKYVPEVKELQNHFLGAPPITLLQLATHMSGLDREPDDEKMLYIKGPASEWEKNLIASIPLMRFINEPGTRYSYSNIGYAILGLALRRAAGEPYMEYIEKHILQPLGMSHTFFVLDEKMDAKRPKGFLIENGKIDKVEPERQERQGRGWSVPVGRLYSTVEDLARFVAFESGEENAGVMGKKLLEENFSRVYFATGNLSYGYGIGFQVRRKGTLTMLGHDGVLAGYQCSTWFDPKTRLGVITLTTRQEKFFGYRALDILVTSVLKN